MDSNGWTALHHACNVKRLFYQEKKIDYESKEEYNVTKEKTDALEAAGALIENGADVDAGDMYGFTPLMFASFEFANLLIKNGADVNARNNIGGTALIWAELGGYTEIAKLLKKN
jgi:ankyrin repeat protein